MCILLLFVAIEIGRWAIEPCTVVLEYLKALTNVEYLKEKLKEEKESQAFLHRRFLDQKLLTMNVLKRIDQLA